MMEEGGTVSATGCGGGVMLQGRCAVCLGTRLCIQPGLVALTVGVLGAVLLPLSERRLPVSLIPDPTQPQPPALHYHNLNYNHHRRADSYEHAAYSRPRELRCLDGGRDDTMSPQYAVPAPVPAVLGCVCPCRSIGRGARPRRHRTTWPPLVPSSTTAEDGVPSTDNVTSYSADTRGPPRPPSLSALLGTACTRGCPPEPWGNSTGT